MKRYDLVVMLRPDLSATERTEFLDGLKSEFASSITDSDEIGLQDLTYDAERVAGNNRGYFVSFLLEADGDTLQKIREFLRYDKRLMRIRIFSMTQTQKFRKFDEIAKELTDIIDGRQTTKMGQRTTFLMHPENRHYLTRKAIPLLKKYLTRFGEIKPRKFTKNPVNVQKKLRTEILRARELGLLSYISS